MLPPKTTGVFAIINPSDSVILLSEYRDRATWNLPGGGVEGNESNEEALYREVLDETGLQVKVLEQIGPAFESGNDFAYLYRCEIVGGTLLKTEESHRHIFADIDVARELPIVSSRMKKMIDYGFSSIKTG